MLAAREYIVAQLYKPMFSPVGIAFANLDVCENVRRLIVAKGVDDFVTPRLGLNLARSKRHGVQHADSQARGWGRP